MKKFVIGLVSALLLLSIMPVFVSANTTTCTTIGPDSNGLTLEQCITTGTASDGSTHMINLNNRYYFHSSIYGDVEYCHEFTLFDTFGDAVPIDSTC